MLCARLLRTARARDWIEVGQARMRRKVQHNAIVQTCQIGTRFTYIGVDVHAQLRCLLDIGARNE